MFTCTRSPAAFNFQLIGKSDLKRLLQRVQIASNNKHTTKNVYKDHSSSDQTLPKTGYFLDQRDHSHSHLQLNIILIDKIR